MQRLTEILLQMIHNVPQPDFERFVAEKLAFDNNVELRKGIAFVCCEQVRPLLLCAVIDFYCPHES